MYIYHIYSYKKLIKYKSFRLKIQKSSYINLNKILIIINQKILQLKL